MSDPPGDVDRLSSRGCNLLIRDGAVPVLDPEDLLEALSLVLGPPQLSATGRSGDADHELVEALGPCGRSLESLAEELDAPASEVLARIARLEAAGRIRREADLVIATG